MDEIALHQQTEIITIHTYKALTTSKYITDAQVQKLIEETTKSLRALSSTNEQIQAGFFIVNGLVSLAVKFNSYYSHERRFSNFFKKFNKTLIENFKQLKQSETDKEFLLWMDENLFFYYLKYLSLPHSPWETLIRAWLLLENDIDRLKVYYALLSEQLNNHAESRSFTLLTSLLALAAEDGARSLQLLKMLSEVSPDELVYHFKLFEKRQDWDTMKHWFNLFLVQWGKQSLGPLNTLYEMMLEYTTADDISSVWNQWLQRPSFQSYLTKTKHYRPEKLEHALTYILPQLREQGSIAYGQQLYFKILQHEKRYEDGISYLLKHEMNPVGLHPEKQAFIDIIRKERPVLLLPLFHQFIIRLIEKKSRVHYEESVVYMKKLASIYKELKKEDLYTNYIKQMKSSYKTYRALLQEMKKIEHL